MKFFELEGGARWPALGLGTWKSAPGEVANAIAEAIEIGYRHFDCSPIYGNEPEIGQALSAAMDNGVLKREDFWVTSKLWNSDHLRGDVVPALKRTLADLRLDYLDLYLVHWPVAHRPGVGFPENPEEFLSPDDAPIAATWAGMEEALNAGLCKHIGVSNFSRKKIEALLQSAKMRPVANQVECHPFLAQRGLLDYCNEQNIVLTAYSPLGSKDRPDFVKHDDEPGLLDSPVILDIADKHGFTAGQVILAWALQRNTSVIPKSTNPGRLRENFAAAQITLDDGDMVAIDGMDRHYRFVDGTFWCPEGSPYTLENLWDE